MTRVLVTGATGNVGSHVLSALTRREIDAVAAVRDGSVESHESRPFDFSDRSTWEEAITGIDGIFLMRPPAIADVENNLNPFVDFARESGVDHVVFLSVAGAGENRFVPHRKVEDHLRDLDDHFTNLRPGFFSQNLESAYREDIIEEDRIYVPAGHEKVNWIDARDIAAVAALILSEPAGHRGRDYTLAGPGPVSWDEVVETLSQVLEREITYEPASIPGYIVHLYRRGRPAAAIAVQTVLHFLLRFGQGAIVDPTLENLLGRPARTIHEYIQDHAEIWKNTKTAKP